MAIMAMATVRNSNSTIILKNVELRFAHADLQTTIPTFIFFVGRCLPRQNVLLFALLFSFLSFSTFAGEWQFVPNFGIEETYTDNVELTITDPVSSLVSQAIIGLDAEYKSRLANLTFSGTNSNAYFSHDSELNNNFLALDAQGNYNLWTSGPQFIATARVDNISRNRASNSLADLVNGDTIQAEYYSTGLQYNVQNNTYKIESALLYNINSFEDGIGEFNGATATLNTRNGNNARTLFWQVESSYGTRSQDFSGETRTGEQYRVDAQLGLITSFNFNPFIRFYDEDFTGNFISQSQQTTSSWGPGVRWLVSPHLMVDLSYNYVADETVSEDYVAASIQWEPSARTSLTAGYSQRFFGDSYNLDLQHRTKRLTNSITYDESLQVFDRNNYEQIDLGFFWCPAGVTLESISQCFVQSEQPSGGSYQLANFFSLEPIESNEFSLNKRFAWTSKLQLARTSFAINTFATRREGLETKVIDETLGASVTIERKISGKSNLTLLAKYDYLIFDKNNPAGSRQEDYYRTVSATYTKDLASSLSAHFTIQQVNRDSNVEQFTYNEMRAIINITKEF